MENIPLYMHFIYATLATCGFAVFFQVPIKLLTPVSLVGGIGWIIYLGIDNSLSNPEIAALGSSAFISLCGEILARKLKQPSIMIVTPGILPLIPGYALYKMVYYLIQKNYVLAASAGTTALLIGAGTAFGILMITSMAKIFNIYHLKKAFSDKKVGRYKEWVNSGKNRSPQKYKINKTNLVKELKSANNNILKQAEENVIKYVKKDTMKNTLKNNNKNDISKDSIPNDKIENKNDKKT